MLYIYIMSFLTVSMDTIIPPPLIEFNEIETEWNLYHRDSTFQNIELQHITHDYNLLPIDWLYGSDNSLYTLHLMGGLEGAFIQKINTENGDIEWEFFDNNIIDTLVCVSWDMHEENGIIKATGAQIFGFPGSPLLRGPLMEQQFNAHNGTVVQVKVSDPPNGGAIAWRHIGRDAVLPQNDGTYLNVYPWFSIGPDHLVDMEIFVRRLDENFRILDTLNRFFPHTEMDGNGYNFSNVEDVGNQIVFLLQQYLWPHKPETVHNEMIWLNKNGGIDKVLDINEISGNTPRYTLLHRHFDKLIVTGTTVRQDENQEYFEQGFVFHMNTDGSHLISHPHFQFDGTYYDRVTATKIKNTDRILYFAKVLNEEKYHFLEENGEAEMTFLYEISPRENLTFYANYLAVFPTGVVTITSLTKIPHEDEPIGHWVHTFAFDTEKIGIKTSTEDQPVSADNRMTIFPNPLSNTLNINARSPVKNIEIFNILGELVFQKKKIFDSIFTVNVEDLSTGEYFLKCTFSDEVSLTQKFVKAF